MKKNIYAIIPAHNEEHSIENTILCLINQTHKLDKIVVVNDFSTDKTGEIVNGLILKFPNQIVLINTDSPQLRAGAVNRGLSYISENHVCDFLLTADADTDFDEKVVEEGLKFLLKDEKIGGVCSVAGVQKPPFIKGDGIFSNIEKYVLWRLHRLEYSGFDAARTATWNNVLILHGLCSFFRYDAIMQVGGYHPNHLLEDYKLTLQLKKAGWKVTYNPRMITKTKVPSTIKSLIRQRMRWMRGGINIILEEGITKHTIEDAFNHIMFIVLLAIVISIVALGFRTGWHISLNLKPLPVSLAVVGYLFSIYNLRYVRDLDVIDIIIRISIMPELMVAALYSWLQVLVYFMTLFKVKQKW